MAHPIMFDEADPLLRRVRALAPEHSVLVLVDPDEREALLGDDRCYVPAYLGAYGWIGLDLIEDTDWDEISELLAVSYRRTAGPRRVAVLDARAPGR